MTLVGAALRGRRAPIIWAFHDVRDQRWFRRCIEDIVSAREVLPLAEIVESPRGRDTCAITFDDGLRSVLDVAAPVLRDYQLHYTVFVCTEVIADGRVPWFLRAGNLVDEVGLGVVRPFWGFGDRSIRTKQELIDGLKQVRLDVVLPGLEELEHRFSVSPPDPTELFLSADDVAGLSDGGVVIGSHTHRHPILSLLAIEEQWDEIERSRALITRLTGRRPTEFAYPNGSTMDFDNRTIEALRSLEFEIAVTTVQRHVARTENRLALPRIGVSDGSSSVRRALGAVLPELSLAHFRERRTRNRIAGSGID
jgi:peptidoglycan/xylan/chitin deacetylase (PgdA/CDA1 family)